MYHTFSRLFLVVTNLLLIIPLLVGKLGFLRAFFDSLAFIAPGRLAYTIYLISTPMTMWFFFNAWHAHGLTSFTIFVLAISIFMLSFLIGVPFSLLCDYPWARLARVLIGTKVDEDMPHYDLQD